MDFKSIYTHKPRPAEISAESEIKCDESLTISQIISLHLRGIPAPVHVYDGVEYEIGDSKYSDEQLNEGYYELENDFSDFNSIVPTSGDNVDDRNQPAGRYSNGANPTLSEQNATHSDASVASEVAGNVNDV